MQIILPAGYVLCFSQVLVRVVHSALGTMSSDHHLPGLQISFLSLRAQFKGRWIN